MMKAEQGSWWSRSEASHGGERRYRWGWTIGTLIAALSLPAAGKAQCPRPGFSDSVIDANVWGDQVSIAVGSDGLAVIAYHSGGLKVAHCEDIACTAATITMVDPLAQSNPSITIAPDGFPLIAYEGMEDSLYVAKCLDHLCSTSLVSVVWLPANGNYLGIRHPSITIGADGLGIISFADTNTYNLYVAHCLDEMCSGVEATVIDPYTHDARSSITIGADGYALIAYVFPGGDALRVAHCSNTACTAATRATLDASYVQATVSASITIGTDGLGLIAYARNVPDRLMVAHCSNALCSSAVITTVDPGPYRGENPSITIGADGLGLVSYSDYIHGPMRVVHCNNVTCTSAGRYYLGPTPAAMTHATSITVGTDGLGLIVYKSEENFESTLRVMHLSNRFGMRYHRPR